MRSVASMALYTASDLMTLAVRRFWHSPSLVSEEHLHAIPLAKNDLSLVSTMM